MPITSIKALRGFLIDSPHPGRLRGIRDGALLIEDGKILDAGEFERLALLPEAEGVIWQHSPESILIPGLVDIQTHIAQYPAVGRSEATLEAWRERHIDRLERDFTPRVAAEQSPAFFQELARAGTTCAVITTPIQAESCAECFSAAETFGIRAIMGKRLRDRGGDARPLEKTAAGAVEETRRLIDRWHGRDGGRLEYVVCPESAATCSETLLRAIGALVRERGVYSQISACGRQAGVGRTAELFPEQNGGLEVLERCGLVTTRTIVTGSQELTEAGIGRLIESGGIFGHCPSADLFLRSGLFPLTGISKAGGRIALGSNVAAGAELSLWRVMRSVIETQIMMAYSDPATAIPTAAAVFHLATQGAAQALGKGELFGTFDPGKDADLVVLDLAAVHPAGRHPNLSADLSAEEIISLFIFRGSPVATRETWVRGRPVYSAPVPGLL